MRRKKELLRPAAIIVVLSLLLSATAPLVGAFSVEASSSLQPYLAEMIAEAPNDMVRVIVQKADNSGQAEAFAQSLGAQIYADLPIINAFAAVLTGKDVAHLSAHRSVQWVSYDAPMVFSGESEPVSAKSIEEQGWLCDRFGIGCDPTPTPDPTEEPTPDPTQEPTEDPTPDPTEEPTPDPTQEPTEDPTPDPTEEPTPDPAECWWNTSFTQRRKITFDNSAATEDLHNFPVLLKLNSSNLNYAGTQDAGQDIRFVDGGSCDRLLGYEIEEWNEAGDSFVWVNVPKIDAGSTTDYIYMYYKNAAAADAQNPAAVWSETYAAVYHMNGDMQDSSGNDNHGHLAGGNPPIAAAGKVGDGLSFNDNGWAETDYQQYYGCDSFSYEIFWKANGFGQEKFILSNSMSEDQFIGASISGVAHAVVANPTDRGMVDDTEDVWTPTSGLNANQWYYTVFQRPPSDAQCRAAIHMYLDGAEILPEESMEGYFDLTSEYMIGHRDGFGNEYNFVGAIDEVRISNRGTVRSDDYIEAQNLSMNDAFLSVGDKEVYTDTQPTPIPDPTEEPTPTPDPTEEPTPPPDPTEEPTPPPDPTEEPTPAPTATPSWICIMWGIGCPDGYNDPTPTPDPTEEPTSTPDPSIPTENTFLDTIRLPNGSGSGVVVAVIDSGVQYDNDFLGDAWNPDRIVAHISGVDGEEGLYMSPNNDECAAWEMGSCWYVTDQYGHGTHIAGIIAGNGDDSNGLFKGIAPQAEIVNFRVADQNGMAHESGIIDALQLILELRDTYGINVRVVNMSMNSTVEASYNDSALNAALEILWFNGIVVVVSAGNSGDMEFNSINAAPANDPYVITVGATDEHGTADRGDDTIPSWSSHGVTLDGVSKPDVYAPGRNIISVLSNESPWATEHPERLAGDGEYFRVSGTSMAAPMVAGVVAHMLYTNPDLTPDQIKYFLMHDAQAQISSNGQSGGYLDASEYGDEPEDWGVENQDNMPHMLLRQMAVVAYYANEMCDQPVEACDMSNVDWDSINWATINWATINWATINWASINWATINWATINWASINWASINWASINWASINWASETWDSMNWASMNWASINWASTIWDE